MARRLVSATLALAIILAALGVAALVVTGSQAANGKYDTDNDGLIEVSNLEQLNAIRYDLNGDGRPDSNSNTKVYAAAFPEAAPGTVCTSGNCSGYELAKSLDFRDRASYASNSVNTKWTEGNGWLPIGIDGQNPFNAVFDGNGATISNLYINRTTTSDDSGMIGLFGVTGSSSIIRQLNLIGIDITGGQVVGGLVGWNRGAVDDSHITGSVAGGGSLGQDGEGGVGGLTGINSGTVKSSNTAGAVSGTSGVGGLVGSNRYYYGDNRGKTATINESYSFSDVSGSGTVIGGLVGGNFSRILNSYAHGKVSSESYLAGGLVGWNEGEIESSFSSGGVSGTSEVGGLAGRNEKSVNASFSTSNVTGNERIGGLVGENSGTVNSSYASGVVKGDESAIGGLVGWNRAIVRASYASGNVSGNGSSPRGDWKSGVGGLIGSNTSPNKTSLVQASFANGNISGVENVGGLVGHNGANGAVIADYATGSVMGENNVGGLVGSNAGAITASYATGPVSGNEATGGVVGGNSGSLHVSFWDIQTSGLNTGVGEGESAGAEAKTTTQLQFPTGYSGVYRVWKIDLDNADQDFDDATGIDDFWDFGTSNQYPVLKADLDGDGNATWREFGTQVRDRPTPTPTPKPTLTPTPTPTPTPAPTSTPIPTPTPTATPIPTATPTPEPTPTPTLTPTPIPTPEPTTTVAMAPTPTLEPTAPPQPTPTPSPTDTPAPPVPADTPASIPSTDAGQEPEAVGGPGGGWCNAAASLPMGAAMVNLLLMAGSLAMIVGLKSHARRREWE